MTPNEFTAWLDGFLDGKESLTAEQITTLRDKAAKMTPLKSLGPLQYPPGVRAIGAAPIAGVAYSNAES